MKRIDASDFWRWGCSDFLSNSLRGVLAEFIVANALGCTDRLRREWDAVDLEMADGLRIEVKSAAYLQSWKQTSPSVIRFDIGKRKGWDAETNTSVEVATRSADVYVFCVFATREQPADPLNLEEWFFLVCSTRFLDERFGEQKSIALTALESAGVERTTYSTLRERVVSLGRSSESLLIPRAP